MEHGDNWAERAVRRAQRMPLLVLLFFLALLASSLFTLAGAVLTARDWANAKFDWRDDEYAKLETLRAGTTIDFFAERLGNPEFQRSLAGRIPSDTYAKPLKRGPYVESVFRGRGYWVQTISGTDGSVIFFAVTACETDFRPTFYAPYRSFKIVLNESTFGQVVPWAKVHGEFGVRSRYFASGATANSSFIDFVRGGNPLDYKTFTWGVNDACANWFDRYRRMIDRGYVAPLGKTANFNGPTARGGSAVRRFRAAVVVNTYGETAPGVSIRFDRAPFQVGVDRIVIRTLAPLT